MRPLFFVAIYRSVAKRAQKSEIETLKHTKSRNPHTATREAFFVAVDSIWNHKLRSSLTLLGVIIGVASVVAVGGAIEGFGAYMSGTLSSVFGNNTFLLGQILRADSYDEYEKKIKRNRPIYLDDLRSVEARCEDCEAISPSMNATDDAKHGSETFYDARVSGVSADLPKIQELELAEGRFVSDPDVSHARSFAVIGSQIRDDLFGPVDALGKDLKLGGDSFTVIGIEERQGSVMGQSLDSNIYIPYTSFLKKYGLRRSIRFRVKSSSDTAFESTQDEVRQIMRSRHKLRPSQEDDFDIIGSETIQEAINEFTGAVAMVVTPITLISLVVGGIVIMNIMLVTVTERTKEIGMRKAVGAKRSDILLQFLIESALLASVGGMIGILIAYAVCVLIEGTTPVPMRITITYVLLAIATSSSVGLVSGIYPAFKASKLDPIVALSRE
jgi:putative ABC transport system permease protein